MQHWAADHEAILDARLAGLKAGLKLTADQEKLWPPFEAAIRDAAKMRMNAMMDRIEAMHEMRQSLAAGQTVSPIDRLDTMAERLTERGAAVKKIADAGKPLYASLNDSQKRLFGLLGRGMFMMGPGHRGMGMMGGGMGMMGGGAGGMGMMGGPGMMGGAGMMGGWPDRMRMPSDPSNDEDDDE